MLDVSEVCGEANVSTAAAPGAGGCHVRSTVWGGRGQNRGGGQNRGRGQNRGGGRKEDGIIVNSVLLYIVIFSLVPRPSLLPLEGLGTRVSHMIHVDVERFVL